MRDGNKPWMIHWKFSLRWSTVQGMTVFLWIVNQTKYHVVHNQKKNCHYDHIPFILKIIINKFLILYVRRNLLDVSKLIFPCYDITPGNQSNNVPANVMGKAGVHCRMTRVSAGANIEQISFQPLPWHLLEHRCSDWCYNIAGKYQFANNFLRT